MPKYDAENYDPPAPVMHAVLRGQPDSSRRTQVVLLLDSGSDVSVLPRHAVEAVGGLLRPSGVRVEFLDPEYVARFMETELTVEFLKYRFRGVYLVAPNEHGILGRNVLQHLTVTLDGPRQQWSA